MKAFYFDVGAELAHFRDHMSHAFLDTFLAPPPHAIIGFLGCCCGFTEKETEEVLSPNVMVGCKILSIRGYLKDLVIMENQKGGTYVPFPRTRKFLVNPLYRIYVAANNRNKNKNEENVDNNNNKDDELLSSIKQAVSSPIYTPYLGISDCIAYVRFISDLIDIEPTRFKETDGIVPFPIGHTSEQKKKKISKSKGHNMLKNYLEYSTRIKGPGLLITYPHVITVPRSYEISETGRKPEIIS